MRNDLKLENDLKLKMEKFYAVTAPNDDGKFKVADFIDKTIKDTEIYRHFEKNNQKLAIYVSRAIPINENYLVNDYSSVGNHCVVATGIEDRNGVKCLVLDNTTGSIEDNYIPVDFPIFEALDMKIKQIERDPLADDKKKKRDLNNYGFGLAQKKFKRLMDTDPKTFKRNNNETDWFNVEKDGKLEYQMFFVKGSREQIYKLEFLQS